MDGRPESKCPDIAEPAEDSRRADDGFPMTVTGKVQKFVMREASVQELGREHAARVEMA